MKVIIHCKKHGAFPQSPSFHMQGGGCPKCGTRNINELRVGEYLQSINIEYNFQHRVFINNELHIYDFYIPKYNLIIEYNGVQHYRPVCFGSQSDENIKLSEIEFANRQRRDEIKRKYCNDNGIRFEVIDGRIYNGKKLQPYLIQVFRGIL